MLLKGLPELRDDQGYAGPVSGARQYLFLFDLQSWSVVAAESGGSIIRRRLQARSGKPHLVVWDFALVPIMVQEIRPRTIIEIGTARADLRRITPASSNSRSATERGDHGSHRAANQRRARSLRPR
jgi:hypothetical protein